MVVEQISMGPPEGKFMKECRWFQIASCVCILFAISTANANASEVGLAKDRPAEGRFVETDSGFMIPYEATIPGTDVKFTMEPIPGGEFTLGSPDSEKDRKADEGPQATVQVEPFWMGRYEVTWAEYKQFMELYHSFKEFERLRLLLADPLPLKLDGRKPEEIAKLKEKRAQEDEARAKLKAMLARDEFAQLKTRLTSKPADVDGVTAPTVLYEPSFTFEHGGTANQPAVTMTPFAARQYTKWLSGLTGNFYRLPAEAEWEYACRAGSATAFHFGDDAGALGDYAWYVKNSDEKPHDVGQKKPNAWGLFDMHGNVAEWVLDEYRNDSYKNLVGKNLKAASSVVWPTTAFPRVLRGGSWDDEAAACRSAARNGDHDDEEWKGEDPNLPLSPWWFTNDPTRGIGFRLVRPLAEPDEKYRAACWDAIIEDIQFDVSDRLKEGRGAIGPSDKQLPDAIKLLEEVKKNGI
jgi:formylglycine-generating enzyme required for sulfatase activity